MKEFGLIGYPLGHSFSERYFRNKFQREGIKDCNYRKYELKELSELTGILDDSNLVGLNVTIPYKSQVLEYCDELSEEVREIGAANTLAIGKSGIKAFNTDIIGFEKSLDDLPFDPEKKALILGTGGAASAVNYVLRKMNFETIIVSRNSKEALISYSDLNETFMDSVSLIVNCTPLGMSPDTDSYPPVPYDLINSNHFAYDLVYNPEMTEFLKKCQLMGAGIKNGLEMLILQAEASWEIWQKHI